MSTIKILTKVALLLVLSMISLQSASQEAAVEKKDLIGRIDLAIPESPAFTALGIVPDVVMRPTSGRALAVGLLNGLDANGNLQRGLAVETRPYLLANGSELTLRDYRTNKTVRNLTRIKLSFATASGQSGSDKADRLAMGVRWTPWDEGDPRLDEKLDKCFQEKLKIPEGASVSSIGDEVDPRKLEEEDKKLREAAKQCITKSAARNWNASAWEIGLAGLSADVDGKRTSGYSVWTSLALPVTENGQFIAHFRKQEDQLVVDPTQVGSYVVQDEMVAAARLRWGGKHAAVLLEAGYFDVEPVSGKSDQFSQGLAGLEFRVSDSMWLQFAIGDRFGGETKEEDMFFSGQVRWAISEKGIVE